MAGFSVSILNIICALHPSHNLGLVKVAALIFLLGHFHHGIGYLVGMYGVVLFPRAYKGNNPGDALGKAFSRTAFTSFAP